MGALNSFPCFKLGIFRVFVLVRVPTYGGWIEDNVRSLERGYTCRFGIPLVPADKCAYLRKAGFKAGKSRVSGSKIEFLEITGVIRYVHLSVNAGNLSRGIDKGKGVVIHTGGPFLKKRAQDENPSFFCFSAESVRDGSGYGFSEIKAARVLGLAEISGEKKFRKTDYVHPESRSLSHA